MTNSQIYGKTHRVKVVEGKEIKNISIVLIQAKSYHSRSTV